MKRTLILFFVALALVVIAWYAVGVEESSPSAWEREFAYTDVENIHRIFIADRVGNRVELTRGGITGWQIGDQPANENAVKNLLQAVTQIEVQRLPSSKAVPNLVSNLSSGGILVQLFDAKNEKLRGYYVGGGVSGENATAAIVEGSENPYVVHLPMWTGNLRHRFNLRGDEWRSKVIFRVDPDRVIEFSIDYPTQRAESFTLTRNDDGSYTLRPYYNSTNGEKIVPAGVAEGILSRYEKYYASRYENQDTPNIEKARRTLPFATISITQEGQTAEVMEVHPRFRLDESGDLRAYTAFINDGKDWVLLSVETTQPLLVSYDSF